MKLDVLAFDVERLPVAPAPAASRYPHLNCIAAVASAPPSAIVLHAAGYAPQTPERGDADAAPSLGEAAERAAVRVLAQLPADAPRIGQLLHCQATLAEQILESVCLRIATRQLDSHARALTLDQAGTCALAAALHVAGLPARAHCGDATLVTAADLWRAPFTGDFAPLVSYADAAGAMVVAPARPDAGAPATLAAMGARRVDARGAFWRRAPELVSRQLERALAEAATDAVAQAGWDAAGIDLVLGEPIGQGLGAAIATALGAPPEKLAVDDGPHLACAAPIAGVARAVAAATERGRTMRCLLWSASPEGSVAALALVARPPPAQAG